VTVFDVDALDALAEGVDRDVVEEPVDEPDLGVDEALGVGVADGVVDVELSPVLVPEMTDGVVDAVAWVLKLSSSTRPVTVTRMAKIARFMSVSFA
jgi:hypothetical protein